METNQPLPAYLRLGADNVYRTPWSSYFFIERNDLTIAVTVNYGRASGGTALHTPMTYITATVELCYADYADKVEWDDDGPWVTIPCPNCQQGDVDVSAEDQGDAAFCNECGMHTQFYDAPNLAAEAKAAAYDRAWDRLVGY
jgi:hypothetical protein